MRERLVKGDGGVREGRWSTLVSRRLHNECQAWVFCHARRTTPPRASRINFCHVGGVEVAASSFKAPYSYEMLLMSVFILFSPS